MKKASVAGSFYPNNPLEIKKLFEHYNKLLDENLRDKEILDIKPKAVLVPHAGYIFSAFTANIAFRTLKNRKIKRVVVIGPSHKALIDGTSIADFDLYETPLGNITIDRTLTEQIIEKFKIPFIPSVHNEHSTEVQMPFIKYYIPDANVVELVYGKEDPKNLQKIIDFVLQDDENAVVISTDLSHYYTLERASAIDNICLEAVWHLDTKRLHQGCEACGIIGMEAMILSAKNNDLKAILLDYRTSADVNQDNTEVVGYMSAAFVKN
ncbi:MAG: AmmeMemoRadiSam system protein B [Epsilonproteobacteria bacterium]|nr:AmmeMemoRadiSam system protein B [Campylobacterota bacterium]